MLTSPALIYGNLRYPCLFTGNLATLPDVFLELGPCRSGHMQVINSGELVHQEVALGQ